MSQWLLPLVSLLYIALLFVVAYWGESHSPRLSPRQQGLFYSLTLAVYCTSWTYYGAVGTAARAANQTWRGEISPKCKWGERPEVPPLAAGSLRRSA